MVINTGCRTDIPAYYSEWFYNRIREGYVLVRNPYYPQQVTRYLLTPEVVDLLCFCTKNPEPMLSRLDELQAFSQFWFVTITPYGKDVEPHVPDADRVMEAFCRLSERVGKHAMSWRYDPVFLDEKYTLDFHMEHFEHMAQILAGSTEQCVVSFIDLYAKTKRNFPGVREVTAQEQKRLVHAFVETGKQYGITIRLCCEHADLARLGADVSGCMTQHVLEHALGCSMNIPKSNAAKREQCSCILGNDIGAYNTCGHGCRYCYANYDEQIVRENMRLHDVNLPFLIGGYREEDVIKDAKQLPWRTGQLSLFEVFPSV